MNKKGFAITSILYGLLIMVLIIIMGTLSILSKEKAMMEELIDGTNGAREIVKTSIGKGEEFTNESEVLNNISREDARAILQKYVVSTAKSYLWNKEYSDYDQHAMDVYNTFKWRNITISPDEISRNNYYHIDCSSFVTSVYYNSLLFDFSKYSKFSSSKYLKSNLEVGPGDGEVIDETIYKREFSTTGGGPSTSMFRKMADSSSDSLIGGIGDDKLVAYYYAVKGDKCVNDSKIDEMYNKLQTGDLMVYRHKKTVDGTSSNGGHVMLFVKDLLGEGVDGFIHATGYSYLFDELNMQEDLYSVQTADKDNFDGRLKTNCNNGTPINTSKNYITSIIILRPINDVLNNYCNNNLCNNVEINKNVLARNEISNMKIEQYAKVGENSDNDVNLGKYQSVQKNEKIRYVLYLGNNDIEEYSGLAVTASIPEGTSFVSCNNNCVNSNGVISWSNVGNKYDNDKTYRVYHYTVNVDKTSGNIVNNGMKITTSSGKELQLSKIVTKVNKTIRDNSLTNSIKKAIVAHKNGYISFNANADGTAYKQKISDLSSTNKLELTPQSFIRLLYYDAYDVTSLGNITKDKIKNQLLLTNNDLYAKKTTGNNTLDKQLVPGLYGGRYLAGNVNEDRITYLTTNDLEIGDVIFYFFHTENSPEIASLASAYIYDRDNNGKPVFIKYSSNGLEVYVSGTYELLSKSLSSLITYNVSGINYNNYAATKNNSGYMAQNTKTSQQVLRELYAQDLFFVFRPSITM